ncbi:2OG-Fe(II) oxygenase [Pseudoalteromonas umbrosa]|uniref:2OG-Fe(II) oxygenase n=1 Tax=Pseudoalteromonas umbrosa TaxID=3048489 RepID=UPI0024C2450A|nr:2OG-Fe(II) oxygenase [Pseudoalteromonas sp. B95]MDK1285810.1 2OG-Fe(II) oxygenase [Pseudoalteromonas sp. B95]
MVLKQLFKWQVGRQKSGYHKMLLLGAHWPVKFDVYLLKFPEGCEVPEHVDEVSSGRHFRLNIVLKKASKGGAFLCQSPLFESDRIKLFRPDRCVHSVSRVEKGERLLLSIGWIRR